MAGTMDRGHVTKRLFAYVCENVARVIQKHRVGKGDSFVAGSCWESFTETVLHNHRISCRALARDPVLQKPQESSTLQVLLREQVPQDAVLASPATFESF